MGLSTDIVFRSVLAKILTVAALSVFITAGKGDESSGGVDSNEYFLGAGSPVPPHGEQHIDFTIRRLKLLEDESLAPTKANAHLTYNKGGFRWLLLFPGVGLLFCLMYFLRKKATNLAKEKEKESLKAQRSSPVQGLPAKPIEENEIKPEQGQSELVFFVEEQEAFNLHDLLEAEADLRNQMPCFSLYKVVLKTGAVYTVKRLKKLQASVEDFGLIMTKVGNMKHPNILLLVGYNSSPEGKLLIYSYRSNGTLFDLLSDHIKRVKVFPWNLRLYIAWGIARGLDFIHRSSGNMSEIIPHGNLRPSNIILGDNMDALIGDYGLSKFLDPKGICLFPSPGYMAPEERFSKQGDVYSFGVILLELLTGRAVENTGLDLPKWVKMMVREEWTGEVFDRVVATEVKQWAFPLLNISLKCVADSPEDRPSIGEVLSKIEEAMDGQMQHQVTDSPLAYGQKAGHQDCCLLHSVIPETWDSPGSNH